jgi:hypothetical protein
MFPIITLFKSSVNKSNVDFSCIFALLCLKNKLKLRKIVKKREKYKVESKKVVKISANIFKEI